MFNKLRYPAAIAAALAAFAALAAPVAAFADAVAPAAPLAKPFLAQVFGDNMILQRDAPDRIWGWTTPGSTVVVTLAGAAYTGTADKDGRSQVVTQPLPAGGPYQVVVTGLESRTLNNVLMGDVWVCSGQSNMEFGIGNNENASAEIAAANYPLIHLFRVPHNIASTPQIALPPSANANDVVWQTCSPDTVALSGWNGFSAVAYFFGRHLYKSLDVPIGLITDPWGGMPAESFVSGPSLKKMPAFKPAVELVESGATADEISGTLGSQFDKWYAANDPTSSAPVSWASPAFDDSSWAPIKVGINWEAAGIPELAKFDGILYYRSSFDLPAAWAGHDLTLSVGTIDDDDTTYLNGHKIGMTVGWKQPRVYTVPSQFVTPGHNTVAVRVLDTGGNGGMYGSPDTIFVSLKDDPASKLPLATGVWKYKVAAQFAGLPPPPDNIDPSQPSTPSVLYNGMVAPIVPLSIKGAIWYQGESNGGRGYQYRTLMPLLIKDWRDMFQSGEFPFFLVQLANWQTANSTPTDTAWAEVREAQLMTVQHVAKTGMAVAIDIGNATDIHPKDKEDVGDRLALNALAIAYGQKIEYSGPIYKSSKITGDSIRISFTHDDGLNFKGDKLTGFVIAGADGVFVPAEAKIDGNNVIVHADSVKEPVAARYAFEIGPAANLYNSAGLPASPFRTDNWRLASEPAR